VVDVSCTDPGPKTDLDAEEYMAQVGFQAQLVEKGIRVVKYSTKKGKREVRRIKLTKNRSDRARAPKYCVTMQPSPGSL
jgi:hypothetical protein